MQRGTRVNMATVKYCSLKGQLRLEELEKKRWTLQINQNNLHELIIIVLVIKKAMTLKHYLN